MQVESFVKRIDPAVIVQAFQLPGRTQSFVEALDQPPGHRLEGAG